MEVIWTLKNGEKRVILTENSFKNAMRNVLRAGNDDFVQLNDPRFDGGTVFYIKKSEILGWRCPGSAMQRYLRARDGDVSEDRAAGREEKGGPDKGEHSEDERDRT